MGIDISGWAEVYDPYTGEWDGIIKINYLVGRTPRMFSFFFGINDRWGYVPVAPNRGMPMNASSEVILMRQQIRDRQFGDIGSSWIIWSEIKEVSWSGEAQAALVPSWRTLFDLMEILAQRYGEGGVRLVVWFTDDRSGHD